MVSWMFWGDECDCATQYKKVISVFKQLEKIFGYEVILLKRVMSLWMAFETVKHVFCPVYVGGALRISELQGVK